MIKTDCATSTPQIVRKRSRVEVAQSKGMHRVVASEAIEPGEGILDVHGVFVDLPSRFSIQVDDELHVVPVLDGVPTHDSARYSWRFLNHSCVPNAAMVGLRLLALMPIQQWEEVTFDYNTTEFEIAEPFRCTCAGCGGSDVRGFKFLTPNQRARLLPHLAEHLRRRC
ncbi:MAG: SET domain-containing protein-lysine N-methyltransferase [Planctomycetota bacterium]